METIKAPLPPVSALDSHLGYWLRRVSNAVSAEFASQLQAKQTSVAEWVLLRSLYERGRTTQGDLAGLLGITRGAVSKVIDKLEAKKWVQTQGQDGDNRVRLLSLTREGRRSVPILAQFADDNDAHFFDCLDTSERRTLHRLLAKVAERHNLNDVPTN